MSLSNPIRVLCVEDDHGTARLLQKILNRSGYQVDIAYDGASGFEAWKTNSYDVLTTDQDMPVMSGLDLIRALVDYGNLPPTIMITGAGNETVAVEAMKLGAADYIIKDSEARYLDLISAVIQEALHKKHMAEGKRKAELTLKRTNRAQKALGNCSQAVIKAVDELELAREVCRIVVEDGGYRLAWVGSAEQDEAKTVRPIGQWGYEEGYLDTVRITWADMERGRGPVGTAIHTGRPALVRHILTDQRFEPRRAQATARGYGSGIALPLIGPDAVFGALNIYAAEPDAFDEEEKRLLQDLAENLAYGIDTLRTRRRRRGAEEALRDSEELHRITLSNISDAVLITDDAGNFTYICPDIQAIFGYSWEEVMALANVECLLGTDIFDPGVLRDQGEIPNIERTIVDKLGTEHVILVNVKQVSIKGVLCSTPVATSRIERGPRMICARAKSAFGSPGTTCPSYSTPLTKRPT
ncbi:response regulator [Thermodesulfobacteriota bacterium]